MNPSFDRRRFLGTTAAGSLGLWLAGCSSESGAGTGSAAAGLDDFVRGRMTDYDIAGVAAAIVRDDEIAWSNTYGFAELESGRPMSLDRLQNICSISKTFTTSALMQLWEQDRFGLDDDVSDYMPFAVRNPSHAEVPITFRLLLTHRSSIRDGSWYNQMYRCGDPAVSLEEWIEGYLQPGGRFYDPAENFEEWAPGDRWVYNNVAYGLLGYLVGRISGQPFAAYCEEHLFAPLGMTETSWFLADIDVAEHVTPYTFRTGDEIRSPTWGGAPLGVITEASGPTVPEGDGHHANCVYNHPNYPDGFLRTSVRQLSDFARAYLNGGELDGTRILEQSTIEEMLRVNHVADDRQQGLTWYTNTTTRGHTIWGHGGSDPGINTDIRIVPGEGVAAIVFVNTWGVAPWEITDHLVQAAMDI